MFLVLQLPGAQGTGRPQTVSIFSEPMSLQHLQLLWLLHGTVRPLFLPRARDFKTDNFDPIFEAVFFTNWKTGLGVFLNVSVFNSSSSLALILSTSFSSFPWQETISMGLDAESSTTVSGRTSWRRMLSTLFEILSNILRGYSDFSKAWHNSFSLFSSLVLQLMIRRRRKHWEYTIPEKTWVGCALLKFR